MARRIITLLLAAFLLATVSTALADPATGVRGGSRERVAVISVRDFNLKKLEGKVVMIAFWRAVDCVICADYIGRLHRMQGLYGEDGLVVVAVNQDRESAAAADLMNSIHPRSQAVLDPTGRMGSDYQLEGMPSTYLYDRNQNLTDKFVGFVREETEPLEEAVKKLVEKKYEE